MRLATGGGSTPTPPQRREFAVAGLLSRGSRALDLSRSDFPSQRLEASSQC